MTEVLITSSVLIAALLVLRKLFRNSLSRRVQYALWGLVLVRLLVPVSLPAVDFSVLTAAKPVERTVTRTIAARPVYVPVGRAPLAEHPSAPDTAPEEIAEIAEGESVWVVRTEDTAVQYKRLSARTVLGGVWLAGSGVAAAFLLAVNLRFWLRLRRARTPYPAEGCALPVYLVETGLSSPCLFGLFRPAVYLTPAALSSPERLGHILAHEETHARHLDHIWTLLRGVCLAVYWFDPLVWMAASASKTDCELACDEGVLARLGEEERIPYGRTLLSLIPVKRAGNPMLAATTMAAGKKQLKDRFTRIAQKPRQFAAAAVTAALLAGIVSACTFTGAKTPEVVLPDPEPAPQEDAGLRALTGEELRFFNEQYFNGGGVQDGYGNGVYSIRNQFANPLNLYDKPEDIDLYELFYCEDGMVPNDAELKAAFDYDSWNDLPCPAYRLTAAEMDGILTQYTGLTLEQTNQAGLDSFTYLPDYNTYCWMHGDTNYPGDLHFSVGTRAGNEIKLYQNSLFSRGWYCVTLEEQEDGGFHFKSNQACEKPAVPTPIPAGEPEAVIPLDGLEPYEAPAVTLETRVDDFEDTYENRRENWNFDGRNILVYWARDGVLRAGLRDRESNTVEVFLSDLGERASVFFYDDLFGHSGFTVSYDSDRTSGVRYPGIVTDYYYFGEDGSLKLLLRAADSGTPPQTMALDLDGDGTDELVSSEDLFVQRDGRLYHAGLEELIENACPQIEYWGGRYWDEYAKCLRAQGYGASGEAEWADIYRWLYYDGENDRLLLFKDTRTWHDHVMDGVGRYVPAEVLSAAKDFAETTKDRYSDDDGVVYDDWRIESMNHKCTEEIWDMTVDAWTLNYEWHTTTPGKVILAGGRYMTEDGWVSPGYPGCDWLFFRLEDGKYTYLGHHMSNDIGPASELFWEEAREDLKL